MYVDMSSSRVVKLGLVLVGRGISPATAQDSDPNPPLSPPTT